jgi:hypothetical protein
MGDLAAHQAGAVLSRGDVDATARVENRYDEGFHFLLDAFCESDVENLSGDVEGQFSHGPVPL